MGLFNAASRLSLSGLANVTLIAVSIALAIGSIGLTALYLIKYIDETPSIKSLQCMAGFSRSYCPRHDVEMADLKGKLADLVKKTAKAEDKLANLRAIETAIDTVTLFETHDDPNSTLRITVGTVYSRLLEPEIVPQHFCYVGLERGNANEDRNLHFQNISGPIHFDRTDLRKAGVSTATMKFGRSVCKPLLIAQS